VELERLWNDRVGADLLEGDKDGLTQKGQLANRMLTDMRGFVLNRSVLLASRTVLLADLS
jgi:hypothetical protein